VNVVPGDEAAGRVANPTVRSELAYQKAQRAKREAGRALRENRVDDAISLFREAGEDLMASSLAAPAAAASELADEAVLMDELADRAAAEASYVSKFSEADRAMKARKRGRRRP
jgi:Ca-activated chloride channel family protein